MTKTNLETKCKKTIFDISKKVNTIYNTVGDMDLKLSHLIEQNKMFYARTVEYNGYE
ncbi:hypothetical protein KAR91_65785 [Candidatus Pacearchaeota archaeon]|nr:hypothetical protein [Candidatus Pacearchaeota archaeon]